MSRNYKDELYDDEYDDYDEEEDYRGESNYYPDEDEYYEEQFDDSKVIYEQNKANEGSNIEFILETLNGVKGPSKTKVSEAIVKKMLELYDYDPDRTLDYFLKQKSGEGAKPKTAPPKAPPASSIKTETTTSTTAKTIDTTSAAAKKEPEIAATSAKANVKADAMKHDLDAMGFKLDVKETEISSDDELDASQSYADTSTQNHMTVVFAGHVDAGKSTLVGNLLMQHQQSLKKSSDPNARSHPLAWLTDESVSEREHGVTIGLAEKMFRTEHRSITILDSPGHRDYIPNMIAGAAEADAVVLVVPGSESEYESSMDDKAQTREHAAILKALGVNQVIVAVNKLEGSYPPWNEERYLKIKADIINVLRALNFKADHIRVIPMSGLLGENLYDVSADCPLRRWYNGPTLVQAIDTFKIPPRPISKPLRAMIQSYNPAYAENNMGGGVHEINVKVLQGRLAINRSVNITMNPYAWKISKIISSDNPDSSTLFAGQQGIIRIIRKASSISKDEIRNTSFTSFIRNTSFTGQILSKGLSIGHVVTAFKATIATLNRITPIIEGASFQLYLLGEEVECQITKFYRLKTVERSVVKYPKVVGSKKTASVRIETSRPITIDTAASCRALGRFALRSHGQVCAVGLCSQLPSNGSPASIYNIAKS